MLVIRRSSFSRANERAESANPLNNASATLQIANVNPSSKIPSVSRIFGTDISNMTT